MHADAAERNPANGTTPSGLVPMAYTIPEVAEALRVSDRQVAYLVSEGAIESFKIGRSRRIPRDALVAYIDSLRAVA